MFKISSTPLSALFLCPSVFSLQSAVNITIQSCQVVQTLMFDYDLHRLSGSGDENFACHGIVVSSR